MTFVSSTLTVQFALLVFNADIVAAICTGKDPLCQDYTDPHCGGKQVIVELFQWKWKDVANECERFLGPKGFCGVQISPPQEHIQKSGSWTERFSPVSYKLDSRSGSETEFVDMVQRCKKVGVRVYANVVLNHMAPLGTNGTGSAGSPFNANNFSFPGVPYFSEHFHHNCSSRTGTVSNMYDPNNVRNCQLLRHTDLDQSKTYVRDVIAAYLNHLIDTGVTGFLLNSAKYMWPADIKAIQSEVKDLPGGTGRPFFYQEVVDRNRDAIKSSEYTSLGDVTEFRYPSQLFYGIKDFSKLKDVVDYSLHMTESDHAVVFVDNHDTQRSVPDKRNPSLTYKNPRDFKMASAFMLAYNYGFPRLMSSYDFGTDKARGPPAYSNHTIKDVTIDSNGTCESGWICEHRWKPVSNMVEFRNAVAGTNITNWKDDNQTVSFSRGNRGFFVMSRDGHIDSTVHTGLPAGRYCDLVTECAKTITVDNRGDAHIVIDNYEEPILAIIVGGPTPSPEALNKTTMNTRTSSAPETTMSSVTLTSTIPDTSSMDFTPTTVTPLQDTTMIQTSAPSTTPSPWKHTVILLERRTGNGQDVFIRGGSVTGCQQNSVNDCRIPIQHRPPYQHSDPHFNDRLIAWSKNDNYLDWNGAEKNQGSYGNSKADGTPATWTSNIPNDKGYNPLNTYGSHYWLVDIDMDCSKTTNGWFAFKGRLDGQWEGNRHQSHCRGSGSTGQPQWDMNHVARCGYLNVFHYDKNDCEIKDIP